MVELEDQLTESAMRACFVDTVKPALTDFDFVLIDTPGK